MGMFSVIKPETVQVTNLVINPSLENVITGFSAMAGSVALSSARARRGKNSLAVTPTTSVNDGAYFGTVSLTSGIVYTFSVDVWAAVGIPMRIYFGSTAAAVLGTPVTFIGIGDWQRITVTYTETSTTTRRLYITKNNSNSVVVYNLDGLTCVALDHETGYIDGDQKDCYWTAAPHNSTSYRLANSREGGEEIDFDDLGFFIKSTPGIGMPGITNLIQENALMPGSIDNGHKVQTRKFILVGELVGLSHANLHQNRKALIDVLKPELTHGNESLWIVYHGEGLDCPPIRIKAKYDQGLSIGEQVGFTEQMAITFISNDPYWREDGECCVTFTKRVEENFTVQNIFKLGFDDTGNNLLGLFEDYLECWAIHPITKELYVGGSYLINATYKTRLIRWDGAAWQYVTTVTINGDVNAMVFDEAGNLIIGGTFTDCGSTAGDYIVKINTTTGAVSAMGTGAAGGNVLTLAYDGLYIYAAGSFTSMGGVANTLRIARYYNVSGYEQWMAMGTGANDYVNALAIDKNGKVYAGGYFTLMGGVSNTVRAAVWYDSVWHAMGTGISGGVTPEVLTIAIDSKNNAYYGGIFTTVNGEAIDSFAMWDQVTWKKLGNGVQGIVKALAIDSNDLVYIGGSINYFSNMVARTFSGIWNGSTYVHLPFYPPQQTGNDEVTRLLIDEFDNIYLGFESEDYGGLYPCYYPALNTVTNPGSTIVYPKMIITGIEDLIYIKNVTTGAVLWIDKTIAVSEVVTIDFDPNNKKIVSNRFGDITGSMFLRNSNFADFYLMPGTNIIACYGFDLSSAAIMLVFPIKYISIDGGA